MVHANGDPDWEPFYDESGNLVYTKSVPTPEAAMLAFFRQATLLKSLVDSAQKTEHGILLNQKGSYRSCLSKLFILGSIAVSPNFQNEWHQVKEQGIETAKFSPMHAQAERTAIINQISMLPFGISLDGLDELESAAVDLFHRRYIALQQLVDSLPVVENPDFRPISEFNPDVHGRVRQASLPTRKTMRVRKRGCGKSVEYSYTDAMKFWPRDTPIKRG